MGAERRLAAGGFAFDIPASAGARVDRHPLRRRDRRGRVRAPRLPSSSRRALEILAVWTLIGLFIAAQRYLRGPSLQPRLALPLHESLAASLVTAYLWAALTPLVMRVARRFRPRRGETVSPAFSCSSPRRRGRPSAPAGHERVLARLRPARVGRRLRGHVLRDARIRRRRAARDVPRDRRRHLGHRRLPHLSREGAPGLGARARARPDPARGSQAPPPSPVPLQHARHDPSAHPHRARARPPGRSSSSATSCASPSTTTRPGSFR